MSDIKILGPYYGSSIGGYTVRPPIQYSSMRAEAYSFCVYPRSKTEWLTVFENRTQFEHIYGSELAAKKALDALCIEHEYKLLECQEDVDKYRLLL